MLSSWGSATSASRSARAAGNQTASFSAINPSRKVGPAGRNFITPSAAVVNYLLDLQQCPRSCRAPVAERGVRPMVFFAMMELTPTRSVIPHEDLKDIYGAAPNGEERARVLKRGRRLRRTACSAGPFILGERFGPTSCSPPADRPRDAASRF
jgi:glutathione S-transferase